MKHAEDRTGGGWNEESNNIDSILRIVYGLYNYRSLTYTTALTIHSSGSVRQVLSLLIYTTVLHISWRRNRNRRLWRTMGRVITTTLLECSMLTKKMWRLIELPFLRSISEILKFLHWQNVHFRDQSSVVCTSDRQWYNYPADVADVSKDGRNGRCGEIDPTKYTAFVKNQLIGVNRNRSCKFRLIFVKISFYENFLRPERANSLPVNDMNLPLSKEYQLYCGGTASLNPRDANRVAKPLW